MAKYNKHFRGALTFILMLVAPFVYSDGKKQIDILSIHSYHQEYPWTLSQYTAFQKQLKESLPELTINYSTEYLDTKRLDSSDEYQKEFIHYLQAKFKSKKPNLIYVTDDNALKFVSLGKEKLGWKTSVIFSGINNTFFTRPDSEYLLTGVYEHKDIHSSIMLAKQIEPKSSSVIFLGDGGATDKAIKNVIEKGKYNSEELTLIYVSDEKLSVLLNNLKKHPSGVVIFTTIGGVHDDKGRHLSLGEIVKKITQTGRKILVMEDAYLLDGVLGGYVTSGSSQGISAAQKAVRIIEGTYENKVDRKAAILSEFILSSPEMKSFGLAENDKRFSKATIINKPKPFLSRYPRLAEWLVWIIVILLALLVSYIFKSQKRKKLLHEQYIDKSTDLYNRVKLVHDIEHAEKPCLIIVDINNFKSINNFYGLKAGDELLKQFGQDLSNKIANEFQVYRIAGNQFGILSKNKLSPEWIDTYINKFLTDIQKTIYCIGDLEVSLTLTTGISRNEHERLIPRAEQALQRAKNSNQSIVVINNDGEDTDKHEDNLLWAQKFKAALADDRVVPYFQPITNNHTKNKDKYEALVRMIDDEGSAIAPFFFLEAAKSTRQYAALTKVMIEKTFVAIGDNPISVSINFTVDDIRNEETILFFKEKIIEYNVADNIIVELTESEGIENYDEVSEFISDIKKLGCKVAIDDFGTGYSNFTHLIHLDVDYLKIDGSIIKNILADKNAEIVAKTIVQFAGQLGIETVAEFVDSQEILDKVCELGIDYSQGYFLGKPGSEIQL